MRKIVISVCLFLVTVCYAAAEGYQVNVQSAKQGGMGHTGTALKIGAESMHFNPAGLGFLNKQIDLSAGMGVIFAKAEFTNGSSKYKTDNDPGTPLFVYAAFKIYDNLSGGISVTTPYGSSINWGKNWPGSYLVQDIALKSFSVQPTVSYRPFDRLSIGAGLMVITGDFSLSRSLIAAGALEGLRALETMVPGLSIGSTLDKYKDVSAASVTLGGDAKTRTGYNIGAMFDVTDRLTIGVSYRSKVIMKVTEGHGTLHFVNEQELKDLIEQVNPYLIQQGGEEAKISIPALDQGTFSAQLPLPSNFTAAVSYKASNRLLLTGEVQFVGWGAYKELNIHFNEEALSNYNNPIPKNYKNTRIYRVGGEFSATGRLDVRLGAYLDQSPVREEYLNPETPSMDKLGITTGFSFRPIERLSVDFSLAYITGFGRDGSYTDKIVPSNEDRVFSGHYTAHAFIPAIGFSFGL